MKKMDVKEKYIENFLEGDLSENQYLYFLMPVEDYLEYDDPDLYINELYED